MRNCLILGSGRSGTSMVAGTLAQSGYFMGGHLYAPRHANPKGFFEDHEINTINEAILKPLTPWVPPRFRPGVLHRLLCRTIFSRRFTNDGRWLAKIPVGASVTSSSTIDARIQALTARAPYCFKDPRFCYTLPVWHPWLSNTRFVCVFRDPTISAQSMLQESQDVSKLARLKLTYADCLEVWRLMYTHVLDIHSHQGEWLFLHYDQVLDGSGLDRLAAFLEVTPDRSFPERALRRTQPAEEMPDDVRMVYERLCQRSSIAPEVISS
ncbi:sulfotransferase [Candidatus Chloroploca sp. Khr17]|uniref:sulfotransferase n=1 Tax=Candidatus Chloroploca sp. Khr17 TaxID=2496869 RepID=UPI00101B6829|nr:sulfotransferase [Candidatus Chloroploca sp. Khr17]